MQNGGESLNLLKWLGINGEIILKIDFIVLFPDNTHQEKRCNVSKEGKVDFDKKWKPELKVGRSTFPERKRKTLGNLFRRKKFRAFGVYGEPNCFTIDELAGRLNKDWSIPESQAIIKKSMAWSLARAKLMQKTEFYVLLLLVGALFALRLYQFVKMGF